MTKNCLEVIRCLRQKRTTNAWIDAICINQEDIAERNAQVARMGDTFRKATGTAIYVGHLSRKWELLTLPTINEMMTIPDALYEDLVSCAWFTRTWIVQEVMLSRRLFFLIGGRRLDLAVVERHVHEKNLSETCPYVLKMYMELSHEYGKLPTFNSFLRPDDPRRSAENHFELNHWRLREVLVATQSFQYLDPRERLFAILPLFAQPLPKPLVLDYSKTVEQVYSDLSWFLLDHGMMETLVFATDVLWDKSLPSWVVDWRGSRTRCDLFHPGVSTRQEGAWSAGGPPVNKQSLVTRMGNVLKIRGLTVDIVTDVSAEILALPGTNTNAVSESSEQDVRTCWTQIADWECGRGTIRKMLSRLGRYSNKGSNGNLGALILKLGLPFPNSAQLACNRFGKARKGHYRKGEIEAYFRTGARHLSWAADRCRGRSLFSLANGLAGFGPSASRKGDFICVFLGCQLPFILRPLGVGGWKLIGECIINGIMNGEAVGDLDWSRIMEGELVEPLQDLGIM